jgi:two-component system phosphate regulon sensor histidine kinase PhoR
VIKNLEKERTPRGQKVICNYLVGTVYADPQKLEQVLTNLVHNAIKYIPNDKTIRVIWELAADEKGILLRVQDDGPGIAKRHLPRLFERFYRVDEGRARAAGGTGLGLAIVKHICLKHGGWVKVDSTIGLGTEFTCYFPKGQPDPHR